jgi:single-strand DNA-binding protein
MNKTTLIGRLVRDPELRFTQGAGIAVTTFCLAVDRNFKNKDGEKEADFINIVVWNKLAEVVANNLSKGRLAAVAGRIQTGTYEAKDGIKRSTFEIVADEVQFLDGKKGQGQANLRNDEYVPGAGEDNEFGDEDFYPPEGGEEDIPF